MDFSIRWFALWIFVKVSKSFFSRMMYRSKAMKKMVRMSQTKSLSIDQSSPQRLVWCGGCDKDHRDGRYVVGVRLFIHETLRGQHGGKEVVGTGKRHRKEEVIDEEMLDQEILRGGIWEYEEDKDGGDTVEGKHVDALHAEDENLHGFGNGKDGKPRSNEKLEMRN